MKFFATVLLFALSYSITAQEKDTIFYNKYWSKTTKDKAFFYRPLPLQKEGDLFVLKDYYKDGNLQMKAYSSSNKKDVFEGKTTWYYKNGKVSSERTYLSNIPHGEEKSYFNDGTLLSEGIYKSGKMFNGTFFRTNTQPMKTYTVENGEVIASSAYYEHNKKVAEKYILEGATNLIKSIYYNKKGNAIVEIDKYNRNQDPKNIPFKVILQINENQNVDKILLQQYIFNENDTKTEVLKDANGKLIGKGTYKNNRRYDGIFYNNRALETYKEGLLNGEAIVYDKNHQEKGRGIYKNGLEFSGEFVKEYGSKSEVFENGELIAVKTKNDYTNEEYVCTYKNNKPFNGSIMSSDYVKVYEKGSFKKEIEFEYNKGRKKVVTFYRKSDQDTYDKITKKVFYKNGKTYTLNYKNGSPNEGVEIMVYGYTTYRDGSFNGPYLIEASGYKESGNYKNNIKEGIITTEIFGKSYKAIFKNNVPFDGAYFDGYKLVRYKNGKKEGCGYDTNRNRNTPHDSLTICYKNDLPNGKLTYFKKGKKLETAIYKMGNPIEGVFYDGYNSTRYKNAEKISETIHKPYQYYIKSIYFKDGKISKEIIKDYYYKEKDTVTYAVTFKNGLPYNGKRIALDEKKFTYTSSTYKNGKKEGEETLYKNRRAAFTTKYNYIKGKKQGKAQFRLKEEKMLYTAEYKDDKPYNGIAVIEGYDFISKSKYKNGEILKTEYLPQSKYQKEKITELIYKDNKPFNGIELIYKPETRDRTARVYKEGTLTETVLKLYNFKEATKPKYKTRILHLKNKDSLVAGSYYGLKPSFTINYSNKRKTSGNTVFYNNDTIRGKASFENNKIKTLSLQWKDTHQPATVNYSLKLVDGKIEHMYSMDMMTAEFQVDLPPITNIPLLFYDLIKNDKLTTSFKLTLLPENISSTITLKDGKPYNGLIFKPNTNKITYDIKYLKEGKIISKKYSVSKPELVEMLTKVQK